MDIGHVEIEQRQIERFYPTQKIKRLGDRARLHRVDFRVGHLYGAVQRLAKQRMVVDDQEPGAIVDCGHGARFSSPWARYSRWYGQLIGK